MLLFSGGLFPTSNEDYYRGLVAHACTYFVGVYCSVLYKYIDGHRSERCVYRDEGRKKAPREVINRSHSFAAAFVVCVHNLRCSTVTSTNVGACYSAKHRLNYNRPWLPSATHRPHAAKNTTPDTSRYNTRQQNNSCMVPLRRRRYARKIAPKVVFSNPGVAGPDLKRAHPR